MRPAHLSPVSPLFARRNRVRAHVPLMPAARAVLVLRLLEGLACAALLAALPIVADALSHGPSNWPDVWRTAFAAAAAAVLLTLARYVRAHGDPALAEVLTAAAGALDAPSSAQLDVAAVTASEVAASQYRLPSTHRCQSVISRRVSAGRCCLIPARGHVTWNSAGMACAVRCRAVYGPRQGAAGQQISPEGRSEFVQNTPYGNEELGLGGDAG